MSLRKQKAAILKISVLENAIKLVGKNAWSELLVEELCAKVRISKVTLFNYFPSKDSILGYYYRIWCFHRGVELHQKPKEGIAGIYYLFDKMAESIEEEPGVIYALCCYLSSNSITMKPFIVHSEEKLMLYENFPELKADEIEILAIDTKIQQFVLEAIMDKEISKLSSTHDLAMLITSLLFGSLITVGTNRISSPKMYLRKNLDIVLNGVK